MNVIFRFIYGMSSFSLTKLLIYYLVGGLEHLDYFPYIGNFIIPTDELIFFKMVKLHHQAVIIFIEHGHL